MKKAVFTIEEYNGVNNAGPKAKNDIDFFLKKENFEIIHQYFNVHSKVKKFKDAYWTIPHLFENNAFDELFFQYPTYSSFLMKRLIKKMREKTKKLFFIIHDVESLRLFQNDKIYWKGERALFNATDGLIVHNYKMKQWLRENGVTVPMVELGIFDYDNPQNVNQSSEFERTVCFAGNLAKSNFLDKVSLQDGKLEVFGSHPSKHYLNGVSYRGQMSPDELPKKLTQNFGLVWDGDQLDTCSGKFGNYMRYNNPHKVSLYLSSGQPVIIWKKAALAEFILKNNVGIAVDSLENLDKILDKVTEKQYQLMKHNTVQLATSLRNGQFILQAVKDIENY
ncbi:sugar transferase [Limosilactobacillus vaginalis]|uniref:Sugar transferase n=1 Tax=Limosilactobacillus vaginalis TaxID=1633 RepID=A0ABT4K7S9_9LACO|nr:sugar transferase [Limosilactobacillus vaginalis]MCZ3747040.1 sugar transferase [Limosilactobacillus vaginalis]MCZ3751968.1 sugar transferase [Limosilactobacillus vaginalis]MCZ3753709.1 sugar transferase [Limosilactobacillus vaginalis]MCZ3755448.1 sugar transferase [Limosilactobacillus vaginalis]MCZ3757143.1 sugar transferase [Limosilactobacillus vaginalis]